MLMTMMSNCKRARCMRGGLCASHFVFQVICSAALDVRVCCLCVKDLTRQVVDRGSYFQRPCTPAGTLVALLTVWVKATILLW